MLERERPSVDRWLEEAKQDPSAPKVGMYLIHNGTVRQTARAKARLGREEAPDVVGMDFSFRAEEVERAVEETYRLPGIHYIRVWLNQGRLTLGEDIMLVLIGGDIRPHVVAGLEFLVGRIKEHCVVERERTAGDGA